MVYEVDVIEEVVRPSGCILENDNIVVTLQEDKIRLSNWSDLETKGLASVDWIKKGEVDIIRCGKWLQMIPSILYCHTSTTLVITLVPSLGESHTHHHTHNLLLFVVDHLDLSIYYTLTI